MISDMLSLCAKEAQHLLSSASDSQASLPNLRPPVPDKVMSHCGGGGSCPTLYEFTANQSLIFQGYPPSSGDEAAVCATTQEPAVVLPSAFFEQVLDWSHNFSIALRIITDPESPIWGPSSNRYHKWPGGDVIVRGAPVNGELEKVLQVPHGEIAIEVSEVSFAKLIRDCQQRARF